MQKLLLFVDKISTWVGQAFSWIIVVLTLHIAWEVFSRYVLDNPRAWAFDAMIMMYGTLFMMAGAYTLAKSGHVRGDVIYGFFTPRAQAILDLTLHRVLHSRDRRADLRRVLLRLGVLGDQRAFEYHRRGPARVSLQDGHPARRCIRAGAGHRRDHPLRDLHQAGRVAVARGGRPGSRRREAEGNGARQGRGYREARSVQRAAGAAQMKLRKELWFGFSLMALIIIPVIVLMPWGHLTNGHLGLMMLALICVGIMLGFPTAFTLMGMGVFFAWLAYRSVDPATAGRQVLDLFVQRTYGVMSNDVLIAIPLFLFMGYLVERAQLIDRLFRSLHLATARVPGSLAVATIVTCAIFATATGIVGAVV